MSKHDPTKPNIVLDEMLRNGPVERAVDALKTELSRPDQLDAESALRQGMRAALIAAARASHDRIDDDICVCGHKREDHYTYILNGHGQVRCKSCDPMAGKRAGNYTMDTDSYVAAMYKTADHDFQLAEGEAQDG